MPTSLTLIGKPDCHLCEDARVVVDRVLASPEFGSVTLEEKSILDDAELYDRHWEEIPVLLVDGKVHTIYRVDEQRLRAALTEAAR